MANKGLANVFARAKQNNENKILVKRRKEAQKVKKQFVKEFQERKKIKEQIKKKAQKKTKKPFFKSSGVNLTRDPFTGRSGRRKRPVEIPRF